MAYKTPGVYIKEISVFPPSVAEVEAYRAYVDPQLEALLDLARNFSIKRSAC